MKIILDLEEYLTKERTYYLLPSEQGQRNVFFYKLTLHLSHDNSFQSEFSFICYSELNLPRDL